MTADIERAGPVGGAGGRRSPLVITAICVALGYAIAFAVVAVAVGFQFLTSTGSIGREHLTGTAAKGAVFLVVALIAATVVLSVGAVRLLRSGRPALIVGPLGAFAVIGCIGETVDLFGTASATSDVIGAGIIIVALVPVALIAIDRAAVRRSRGN